MVAAGALSRPAARDELRAPTHDDALWARIYRPLNPALPAPDTAPRRSEEDETAEEEAEDVRQRLADLLDRDGVCSIVAFALGWGIARL